MNDIQREAMLELLVRELEDMRIKNDEQTKEHAIRIAKALDIARKAREARDAAA